MVTKMKNVRNLMTKASNVGTMAKAKIATALVAANVVAMTALCTPTGNIETIVNTVGKIIFGFIWFIGAIQLVMGIVSAVKAATDEDQGGDQNGISKGVKKAIAGILLVVGPAAILALVGLNPLSLGTDLFAGM